MSMIWNKHIISVLVTFYDFAKGVEKFLDRIKDHKTFPVFEALYPPLTDDILESSYSVYIYLIVGFFF